MDLEQLFKKFYNADTEDELDKVVQALSGDIRVSWDKYGKNESYFAVIENQQASAVPALVEKITNSIDAILMRRCYEEGIDPKAPDAPKSVNDAIKLFFESSRSWDLPGKRAEQSESIQILARGPRKDTSIVIYDDGEGQHPEKFSETLLSLLRSNKNEIPFVQGKYNMGGAGAVVFCGKKRYQLVASRRFDKTGEFGFTILRRHPLSPQEKRKNTWYEYLLIDGKIPSFEIDTLDLGLHNRVFTTGTVIKLYSYKLPPGSRSVISRDLNQSINEFLFEPALPVYTIDTKQRYPDDVNLERQLYGLKRRLEEDGSKYIKTFFSESHDDDKGSLKINVYVFNPRIDGKSVKEIKKTIKREFFKNNMSVMFSLDGQVHGHFTQEFIVRSLKFNLLKDYLLIHVDCTNLKTDFRHELFMASRDRLKESEESIQLRKLITDILTKGRLKEIFKEWKDSMIIQSDSAEDLLKDFSKHLPMDQDFMKLLSNTFSLDIKDKEKKKKKKKPADNSKQEIPFNPKRFPSIFDIDLKSEDEDQIPLTKIPFGGEKTLSFSTDVEDQYFDRIEEPGHLELTVLSHSTNETQGGKQPGEPKEPGELINVSISSPSKGKIRVNINPENNVNVGDAIKIHASLTSPEGDLEQVFIVQISDKENKQKTTQEPKNEKDDIGLPRCQQVFESHKDGFKCWGDLDLEMDYGTVMHPLIEGDKLDTIFINMDSSVLKTYKAKLKSEEQMSVADKRYLSAVYFHTLFLYTISKNKKYEIKQLTSADNMSPPEDIELEDYLKNIFDNHYAEFLLNFEIAPLLEAIAD